MIDPGDSANVDFSDLLVDMARDNAKVSKKMAKSYLKGIAKSHNDVMIKTAKQIKNFLLIDDSLR